MLARIRTLLVRLGAACLYACGGGGGGDGGGNPPPPPPPPSSGLVALTSTNAETVGVLAFGPTDNAFQAMQLLTDAAYFLQDQAMVQLDLACSVSGIVSLIAADRNGNGSFGNGDSVFVTYNNCNGETSGTLRLDITSATYDATLIATLNGTVTIDLNFPGSPPADLNGSGTMAYALTDDELSLRGSGFTVTLTLGTQVESLSNATIEKVYTASPILRYSVFLSGTIDSDFLGGRFSFTTNPPFVADDGQWPETGRLTATGRNNSTVAFRTAIQIQATAAYEVDADGNGVIDNVATNVQWEEISIGLLFGIDDGDLPPPPNPGPDVLGRRIDLGADGEDLLVDNARGRFYVTLPAQHELLVFSAQTLEVLERIHLTSRPNGVSLSGDGQEIFVALGGSGSVAVVDADTFAVSNLYIAPDVFTSRIQSVVETSPGILYAATGILQDEEGSIARIDRSAGTVTRITTAADIFGKITLLADPANDVLYASDGLQDQAPAVRKLDPTDAPTPLLELEQNESIDITHRLSLAPGGDRLYVSSGKVLDTSDFSLIGRIGRGTPAASRNGADVLVGTGDGTLNVFTAADLRQTGTLETDCALTRSQGDSLPDVDRLAESPFSGKWILLGGDILCVVDLHAPHIPPGTGQPGEPPVVLPVTTIESAVTFLSNTIADMEFDEPRNRLYVSMPSAGTVVTIDASTHQVIDTDTLGNAPRGLDLSPDGSTLAILFNGNGNIGFKNLTTGTTEMRDLSTALGAITGHDVEWVSDEAIFATTEASEGGYIVRTSRSDPDATTRVANDTIFHSRVELTPSPDGDFLYAVVGDNRVFQLDLNTPGAPYLRVYQQDLSFLFTQSLGRASVSPDGTRISFGSGEVLRTDDFFLAGEMPFGFTTLYSPDGGSLYRAVGPDFLDRYDPETLQASERIEADCFGSTPTRLLTNAAGTLVISQGQTVACFRMLDTPAMGNLRIGKNAAIRGAEKLLKQYRNQAANPWAWRRTE